MRLHWMKSDVVMGSWILMLFLMMCGSIRHLTFRKKLNSIILLSEQEISLSRSG